MNAIVQFLPLFFFLGATRSHYISYERAFLIAGVLALILIFFMRYTQQKIDIFAKGATIFLLMGALSMMFMTQGIYGPARIMGFLKEASFFVGIALAFLLEFSVHTMQHVTKKSSRIALYSKYYVYLIMVGLSITCALIIVYTRSRGYGEHITILMMLLFGCLRYAYNYFWNKID